MISSHNKKLVKNDHTNRKSLNCRSKSTLNDQCQTQNIIYKCTVSLSVYPDKVYSEIAKRDLKKRYYNHKKSFRISRYTNDKNFPSVNRY